MGCWVSGAGFQVLGFWLQLVMSLVTSQNQGETWWHRCPHLCIPNFSDRGRMWAVIGRAVHDRRRPRRPIT